MTQLLTGNTMVGTVRLLADHDLAIIERKAEPMTDVRRARRDAEKAAREALNGTLVNTAGELGVALAGQVDAAENVAATRLKAQAIVEAAQVEGAALVATAEAEATKTGEAYAAAWNAGKDAGWAPAQLRAMGYAKPPAARRTTVAGSTSTVVDTGSNAGDGHVADVA